MAESEADSRFDEMERDNLQKAISDVETKLLVSTPGTRSVFENFLLNAKGRVATLDKKIKDSQEHDGRAREQTETIAYLAQKEAALSASEKETYSGFLGKEFFTKKDFGSLEQFYGHTWDRLSESGKNQMSHRIWEGIRHDEYRFSDLPDSVREKEARQAYNQLRGSSIVTGSTTGIPESDKKDFIRAYEGGHRREAEKTLERECFKKSMFLDTTSTPVKHTSVERGRKAESGSVEAQLADGASVENKAPSAGESAAQANLELSDLKLSGVRLSAAPDKISATEIPSTGTPSAKRESSLRGC